MVFRKIWELDDIFGMVQAGGCIPAPCAAGDAYVTHGPYRPFVPSAANGSTEPKVTDAAQCTDVR